MRNHAGKCKRQNESDIKTCRISDECKNFCPSVGAVVTHMQRSRKHIILCLLEHWKTSVQHQVMLSLLKYSNLY